MTPAYVAIMKRRTANDTKNVHINFIQGANLNDVRRSEADGFGGFMPLIVSKFVS